MATNYDFDGANALSGHDGQPSDDTASTLVALAQSPASDGQVTATPAEGAIDDAQPVDVGQGAPLQAQADTPATGTAAAGGTTVYAVDASNTVTLPANVSIENMKIEGNDLVLEQADGTQIVIKDGALHVPTFIIDGFEVPRVALLAAIQANGMDVAYGADGSISVTAANPNADSSGANLEVPAGGIGDGLGITALLLNTDLSFDRPDAKELFGLRQPEPEEPAAPALNLLPSIDISGNDAVVDEAALPAGTNPLSVGETRSGTFTIGAGDGIQALIIDGVNVTNGGTIVGLLGTLTLTGDPVTGIYNWTFTLTKSTPTHTDPTSTGTTEGVSIAHTIVLVDANGDTVVRTLNIGILDDGPTASDEASQNVAEGATVIGTLDFVAGADGATVTQINGTPLVFGVDGYSQLIDIGTGVIKVKADGSYSFTADNSTVSPVAPISATYTVTDGDGDTATANIAFQVTDANVPTGGTATATVDDDGLTGGNTASTIGDINANTGDLDGAGSSEASFSGVLGGSVGGDAPGTFSFAALNGTSGTVGQETVTYSWNAGTNTLTATGPRGTLFTVQVTDPATGAYHVTLVDNVLQDQGPNNENDATVGLGYVITDADGSTAPGTLTINFNDDAPSASDEASQNVAEGATVIGTLDFVAGADGATVTQINGTPLVFGVDGYSQLIDIGTGVIKVKADGSYSFTADNSTVNPVAPISATYTVTDGDGDTATANIAFQVTDANVPTGGTATATVDDDGLTGGNTASTIGDINANTGDLDGAGSSEASFSGVLGGSVGGDAPGTFSFAALNGTSGTVGQETVTYSWNAGTNTLTATGPRGTLFTVQVTDPATGAYHVTLVDNVLQDQGPNNENDATVGLGYVITDADGSTAPGTLTINFNDDAPSLTLGAVADGGITLTTQDAQTIGAAFDTAQASFAAAFLAAVTPAYGADGPGTTTISGYTLSILNATSGLTSNGEAITLSMSGTDVVGSTALGGEIFRISVDANGQVTLKQSAEIDHLPEDVDATNDNTNIALAAGKVQLSATATVTDGDNDTATTTVSADLGGNISFDDDVPSLTLGAVADGGITLTTQDAQTIGAAFDTAQASFAAAFLAAVTPAYGADGPGTAPVLNYALGLAVPSGSDSGLDSNGAQINLFSVGGVIYGSTTNLAANAIANAVFSIAVSGTGVVTLTQFAQIDHPIGSDPTPTLAPFEDHLAVLGSGLVSLTALATITDGDGDTSTDSATIDLGGNIRFADDGPDLTSTTNVVVPNETGTYTGYYSVDPGADQPVSYAISGTAPSGLTYTYSNNNTVLLAETSDGTDYFRITVNNDGTYDVQLLTARPTTTTNLLITGTKPGSNDFLIETTNGFALFDGIVFTGGNQQPTYSNLNAGSGSGSDKLFVSNNGFSVGASNGFGDNNGFITTFASNVSGMSFVIDPTGSVSTVTVSWWIYDNGQLVGTNTGDATSDAVNLGGNTTYTLSPGVQFDKVEFRFDLSGNDSIRVQDFSSSQQVVPQDQSLDFTITATDSDGDRDSATFGVTLGGGSTTNDTLTGTSGADVIYGASGQDSLHGLGGNDTLIGGAGGDTLDGGSGNDTASYKSSGSAVTITLGGAASGGDATGDTLTSIENLTGSAFADSLTGDGNANLLMGGADADVLNGGDGNDTASYETSAGGVTVTINSTASGWDAAGDILTNFENLTGSNFADTLTGDGGANTLKGLDGNDQLFGLLGNDTLYGGSGLNTMTGGAGSDTFVIDPSALTEVSLVDVISDFTPGLGNDILDLSDLLASLGANAPTTDADVDAVVNVTVSNGAAHVFVDDNGTASGGTMHEVASLTGVVAVGSVISILYDDTKPVHPETVT